MILGLSSADGGMTVGLWKLSSLDGRRPPWYWLQATGGVATDMQIFKSLVWLGLEKSKGRRQELTSLTWCATFVALPVRHDAPLEWLSHVPLRAMQMQMRELYDQSEYLLWFCPCFFHSSRRRKLFLDRFSQRRVCCRKRFHYKQLF